MPIIEPAYSKRCAMCDREFAVEGHSGLSPLGAVADSVLEGEPVMPSLARFLSEKFEVCPYCGGKYCD